MFIANDGAMREGNEFAKAMLQMLFRGRCRN